MRNLGLEERSLDSPRPSLGVLTLNHITLQLADLQWLARSLPPSSRFSVCLLFCDWTNRRLSPLLFPAYRWQPFSCGLSAQPLSWGSTQIERGNLNIRLPPSSAILSTPYPGSLGQVAGIWLFSSLQLPSSPNPTPLAAPPRWSSCPLETTWLYWVLEWWTVPPLWSVVYSWGQLQFPTSGLTARDSA